MSGAIDHGSTGRKRSSDLQSMDSSTARLSDFDSSETVEEPVQKDPNLGKWEKHTKGFGMKMLAKMGYKGSGGLGSKRRIRKHADEIEEPKGIASDNAVPSDNQDSSAFTKVKKGISRPVEVVVRPANMGLGYGNFKEASQLKSNRIIEAEVRGVELADDDEHKSEELPGPLGLSLASNRLKSDLPSTRQLIGQKRWKRGTSRSTRKALAVVPYTELLKKQEELKTKSNYIIDMRGPEKEEKSTEDISRGEILLAEELLHNVSFLLNTYENKLRSSAQFVRSGEQSYSSFTSDIERMKERQTEGLERIRKLEELTLAVDQVLTTTKDNNPSVNMAQSMQEIQSIVANLGEQLSKEDRELLKFWEIVAPSLLSPVLQSRIDGWDPLGDPKTSAQIIDEIVNLGGTSSSEFSKVDLESMYSMRKSVILGYLLPRVVNSLGSLRWNPQDNIGISINLIDLILAGVARTIPTLDNSNESSYISDGIGVFAPADGADIERNRFVDVVNEELIHGIIYPKIFGTLKHWKPQVGNIGNKQHQLKNRFDLWVIPWLGHLDHPAILPELMQECKRKLKVGVKALLFSTDNISLAARSSLDILSPWVLLLGAPTLHNLTAEMIIPCLSKVLSKEHLDWDPERHDFSTIDLVYDYYAAGVLSDAAFLCIMEGEVLVKWASIVYEKTTINKNIVEAKASYRGWKRRILLDSHHSNTQRKNGNVPHSLLQQDKYVCRIFLSVLDMIRLAGSGESGPKMVDIAPPATSFETARIRRLKHARELEKQDIMKVSGVSLNEARIRSQARLSQIVPFREVVEEFAQENQVLFRPRFGNSHTKDGKQIYLFGSVPSYIDGDLVYAIKDGEWRPVSFEELLALDNKKK